MTKQDILIRAVEPEDFEAFHDIHAQPKVIWGTAQMPYPSAAKWRARLASPSDAHLQLVAEIAGRVVGAAGLVLEANSPRRKHAASMGISVHDDFQGQGVGRTLMAALIEQADGWLNLRRVDLRVYTDNHGAIALYREFGFEVEGTLRDHAFREGHFIDAYMMARLNAR
jgi:putative acetyltransferase